MIYRWFVAAADNLQVQLEFAVPLAFRDLLDQLGSKVSGVQQVQWEELAIQVNDKPTLCFHDDDDNLLDYGSRLQAGLVQHRHTYNII